MPQNHEETITFWVRVTPNGDPKTPNPLPTCGFLTVIARVATLVTRVATQNMTVGKATFVERGLCGTGAVPLLLEFLLQLLEELRHHAALRRLAGPRALRAVRVLNLRLGGLVVVTIVRLGWRDRLWL